MSVLEKFIIFLKLKDAASASLWVNHFSYKSHDNFLFKTDKYFCWNQREPQVNVCWFVHRNPASSRRTTSIWGDASKRGDDETSRDEVKENYNLGQNKREQQTPIPPKSRMKPQEGRNTPFSYLWFWGNGKWSFNWFQARCWCQISCVVFNFKHQYNYSYCESADWRLSWALFHCQCMWKVYC